MLTKIFVSYLLPFVILAAALSVVYYRGFRLMKKQQMRKTKN